MSKKAKLISILMAVSVASSLVAGCGNKATNTSTTADTGNTSNTSKSDNYAPEEGKKYTISWTNYQILPPDQGAEMIKYVEDKFNVKIDLWNIDNTKYDELLNVRLASGEIPDLCRMRDPNSLSAYVDQGVLSELPKEVISKYAPNIYKVINDNAPGFLEFGKVDGKQYAIPAISSTNIFRKPLVYRKDWMDAVGVTKTPETVDEFETLMYKFANEDPDKNGKKDTYGLAQTGMLALFGAYGYMSEINYPASDMYYVEKNGKLVLGAIQPEVKDVLTKFNKWYKDGILDPEFITGENKGGYKYLSHSFIQGRIGFSTMGNYYHWLPRGAYKIPDGNGGTVDNEPGADALEIEKVNPNEKTIFGMPLKTASGQPGIKAYNRLENFYGVGKTAEKEKGKMAKVLQILDYVSANPDPTEGITLNNGVKGKHWDWLDKEHQEIKVLPPYDKMDNYSYKIGGHLGMDLPFALKSFREEWAYKNNFDKYGIESKIQIGVPSYTKSKDELSKLRDQAFISIITGEKPISYFDDFVKKYKEIGGNDVEKEVNEWYAQTKK